MASLAVKLLTKKFIDDSSEPYKKKKVVKEDDPFFEMVPVPGKPGKMKKVKKQIPNYIPDHDALILAKARKMAYILDMSYSIFGISIGISSLVGFIPFLGDVLDLVMAAYLYNICTQVDCALDAKTTKKMKLNLLLDFGVGLVPIIGDLGDAYFRCNTKNVRLLERRLDYMYMPDDLKQRRKKGEKFFSGMTVFKTDDGKDATRKSKKNQKVEDNGLQNSPATIYEEFSDDESPGLPFTEPRRERREPTQTVRR